MISKTSIGRIFGAIIRYCIDSKQKGENVAERGEILVSANCFGNKNQIIRQFNDQKNSNHKVGRAVWHTSFSFPPEDRDKINDSILTQITQDFAKEFGFEQYIAIKHTDTEDRFCHFHFIGNRINLNSKTVSDSNNYKKVSDFCRRTEKTYFLTQVLNPIAFQSKEEKKNPRKDTRKMKLKQIMFEILKTCKSVPELKERLLKQGYKTEIQRGIVFIDEKLVRIKGSQIDFPLEKVNSMLQKNLSENLKLSMTKGRTRQLNIEY
jgi:hypothetical protein